MPAKMLSRISSTNPQVLRHTTIMACSENERSSLSHVADTLHSPTFFDPNDQLCISSGLYFPKINSKVLDIYVEAQ
jgi:hypothetical protein